jgi:hypothetical protein
LHDDSLSWLSGVITGVSSIITDSRESVNST